MGILKIAVCDDEVIFAKKLKELISMYCTKKQILYELDLYQSGKAFLSDNIKMMEYQIVFFRYQYGRNRRFGNCKRIAEVVQRNLCDICNCIYQLYLGGLQSRCHSLYS